MAFAEAKQARFGVFDLDLTTGELRKGGTRIRLQEQPFVVLQALLENPGRLVSKEELQSRLWPDDVHVDIDDGLSTAVRRIRSALDDSARTPRFIETIPKRGYRFIAPVELVGGAQASEAERRAVPAARRWPLVALATSLTLLALLAFGAFLIEAEDPGPPLLKFVLAPGEDVHDPVVSPDGNYVAFVTLQDEGALWIRELRAEEPWKVLDSAGARWPLWSPDSRRVAFQSRDRLLLVDAQPDARPGSIGNAGPLRSACWSADGDWLYFAGNRRSVKGAANDEPVIKRDGEEFGGLFYARDAIWLPIPSRRVVLLHLPEHNEEPAGIYLVDYDSGEVRFVVSGSAPAWSPTGHIIFQEDGSVPRLRALTFSLEQLKSQGEAFVVAENAAFPSVSNDGKLVFLSGAGSGLQVVMRDRSGALVRTITPVLSDPQYVGISPSGEEVAFTALTGEDREIWIARTDEEFGEPRRLTFNDTSEGHFLWSPDGERMLFRHKGNEEYAETYLLTQTIRDGRVDKLEADGIPAQWWGDGKMEYLLYADHEPPGSLDYGQAEPGGEFELKTFRKPIGLYSQLSPEGDLISYMTWPEREFLVQPFPSGEGRWQLQAPGERIAGPRWSRTKQEIFYRVGDTMRVAGYARDPGFRITDRQTLFRAEGLGFIGHFDVMPDGENFVLLDILRSETPTLRVTQNWFSEFRDRGGD